MRIVILVALVLIVVLVVRRLLSKPPTSPHHAHRRCPSCGWSGSVSAYKPVCPRCAKDLSGG